MTARDAHHRDQVLEDALRSDATGIAPSPELEAEIVRGLRAVAERQRAERSGLNGGAQGVAPRSGRRSRHGSLAVWFALGAAAALLILLRPDPQPSRDAEEIAMPEAAVKSDPLGEVPSIALVSRVPSRFADPFRRLFRVGESLLPDSLEGDPLLAEAENLLSDASRAALDFVSALPGPLRYTGRPQ